MAGHPDDEVRVSPPDALRAALLSATLLTLLDPAPAAAWDRVHHGQVPRATGAVHVDGRLDEPTWATALAIELRYEISPGDNVAPPVRTTCLLAYDERRLYVAFRADDPEPGRIRAHLADRDTVHRNDYVGIVLDPFNDGRRGLNFMVNPLGVQMDASASDVGGSSNSFSAAMLPSEDVSWDAIWDAAGRITADGYEVEMAIPFGSLRFPRLDGPQTWGVVPFRAWPRDSMHKIRAVPRDRARNCWFCQAGSVGGLEGLLPGLDLEFDPTITTSRTDVRPAFPDGPLAEGSREDDLGLTARWGVTPNLALQAAVNPDFSQVESDAAQLSINRRFALYFREKRPLFQEGADFFATPFEAVYTRTVADPSWGVKLTGKEGPHAIGAYVARDRVTNIVLPGSQGSALVSIDDPHTAAVARYRRDVGAASAVGALVAVREGPRYHNRVGGVDAYLRPTANDTLRLQALRSDTRDVDAADDLGGYAWFAEYVHSERNWNGWGELQRRDAGFRADAGYLPRVDVQAAEAGLERIVWGGADRWFNRLRFSAVAEREEDTRGGLLNQHLELGARYEGPWQSTVMLWKNWMRRGFAGREFDGDGQGFFYNVRPTGDLTHSLDVAYYGEVDYERARQGRVLNVTPGFTYNLGRHLYAQLDHRYERFTSEGERVYVANLTELRLVWQFTVRLFARAIVQRDDLELTRPDGIAERTAIRGQYLLSYKVDPQTVFFLGYSESRRGTEAIDRTLEDRTFFLKLGYAWVL